MQRQRWFFYLRLLFIIAVGIASAACSQKSSSSSSGASATASGGKLGGKVSVLASWGGAEQDSFMAMVKPFEDQTGVQVQYEGTRDLNAVLTSRVQGGNPPDLAGLPGPAQMADFARAGKLVDLNSVLDQSQMKQQYADSWLQLGQVDGKQVGIFIKTALKGLIWYNPSQFSKVSGGSTPKTWDDLTALSNKMVASGTAPWCIGLESAATSGWPGTDWLSSIILHQSGPDVYDQWYQGKLKWSSPQIKQAWQTWGQIVADPKMVYGGKQGMLATNFGTAGDPMFANPPKCYMDHQGDFMATFFKQNNPSLKPGDGYDFFIFPDIDSKNAGSIQVAGDLFGMFHDTPQSRALIKYLTTPQAQAIWVQRGGALSPNKQLPQSAYPDQIASKEGQIMDSAKIARFSAGDLMPQAMTDAFYKAVLDYIQNPGNLDSILANLDKVQADAYKH
jgi:alpha-glucoside transport system substrate-binding protein